MLRQAVSVLTVHLMIKITSLMAMKEGLHLSNTALHLNVLEMWQCSICFISKKMAECVLFYALTCNFSAPDCNLNAVAQYVVANLHYACHIVD